MIGSNSAALVSSAASSAGLSIDDFVKQAEEHFDAQPSGATPTLFIPKAAPGNAMGANNRVAFAYRSIEQAFPTVVHGHRPLGSNILLQVRQPLKVTAGGIYVDTESRKTERDVTQVARVLDIGPLAFRNRNTGEPWPEGAWCKVGDFVRIPKYQGDRLHVETKVVDYRTNPVTGELIEEESMDAVELVFLKELSLVAVIDGDPLTIRSYL